MRRSILGALALSVAIPASVAAKRRRPAPDERPPSAQIPNTPTTAAQAGVYVRAGFDDDPSAYLGRFIAAGTEQVDETSAAKTTCSQFINHRRVGGGGVEYDELYQASAAAAGRLGVPLATLRTEAGGSTFVRVSYTLTDKMIADVTDPAGLDACCEQHPDQCTDRYIGEFMGGTGELWYIHTTASETELSLIQQGLAADVEFAHGTLWKRAIRFPNPVYFAFKTTERIGDGCTPPPGCGDWIDQAPSCGSGLLFVGASRIVDDESLARKLAREDARDQILQWQKTDRSGGSYSDYSYSGGDSTFSGAGGAEESFGGTTRQITDRNWCIQPQPSPAGMRYKAYVLSFLPQATADAMQAP